MRASPATHLARFQQVFRAWQWPEPGQRQASPLTIAQVLRRWAAEVPEDAATVQRLAVGAAETLFLTGDFEAAQRVAHTGLDASLLGALDDGERRAAATWLALLGARAAFELGDPADARVLVDRANDTADSGHPLAHYLRMHRNLVEARLAEAALEIGEARRGYEIAAELEAALTTGRRARALTGPWTELMFGSGVPLDGGAALLGPEMRQARQLAVLGLARTAQAEDPARDAVDVVAEEGLPDESVLALVGVLSSLPPGEIDAAAARFVAVAADDPDWVLGVRALQTDAWLTHGDVGRARQTIEDAFRSTHAPSDAITFILGFAALARQRHLAGDHAGADEPIDMVLLTLADVAPQLATSTLGLRLRAACEPALVAAVREPGGRQRTAMLIEALRSPEDASVSTDRIGRLAFAVRNRPGVLVLVIQSVGEEAEFLCVGSGGENTVRSASAQRVLDALTDGMDAALRKPVALETLGRNAFDALPDEVRAELRDASTVIVVPDFGHGRDRVPIELLHDGQSFLGISKAISRCLSLAHALRVLEPPLVVRSSARRALCIAVSSAPGLPDLSFADAEIGAVRDALAGWDVESWTGFQATPQALLEIAPLAGVLHLACHGDAAAGAESLVLSEGARVKALDIALRHRLDCVTYLNACSLGRGRYVGGGVSRGVAYAFARAGSPAVVANLSPVEDRSAAQLAAAFYTEARDHPVGEALRRARARMADLVSPVLWGTTVLIGTPFERLDGTAEWRPRDATAALFNGEPLPTQERLVHALATAQPDDLRLAAALEFVDTPGHRAGQRDRPRHRCGRPPAGAGGRRQGGGRPRRAGGRAARRGEGARTVARQVGTGVRGSS
ncbi:CHAT domain-containing protein [Lentzea sp. NPDC005914]|uniref:CHAT domain-containing protein n=1 Tax=Lentzea sp. NPDC005914 TaxID=3154572 RepID=UPI0033D57AC6